MMYERVKLLLDVQKRMAPREWCMPRGGDRHEMWEKKHGKPSYSNEITTPMNQPDHCIWMFQEFVPTGQMLKDGRGAAKL